MKNLKILTCALFALLLAACGGGGGGGGGNPANPIPPDAEENSALSASPSEETVDDAVNNAAKHGSVTQSSNGSGGTTTDTFSVSYDAVADKYTFTKTNSADSSKSWSPILVEPRGNGSGSLFFVLEDDDSNSANYLIHRIANDKFAFTQGNDIFIDANNWVAGGLWSVMTDHDNKVSGYLDDLRAHVDSQSYVLSTVADDIDCAAPCRISWGEAGVFADGAEWNETLPTSGSATYVGLSHAYNAYDAANPDNAPYVGDNYAHSDNLTLVVSFGGNGGTSVAGDLGFELSLSTTDWDPSRGDYGAFYGADKISCVSGAAFCQSVGSNFFTAQFFGENDSNDGNKPNLIGGTFSVNRVAEHGYISADGSEFSEAPGAGLTEANLTSDLLGGFSGAKQ